MLTTSFCLKCAAKDAARIVLCSDQYFDSSVRALVALNLHSYGSGRNPWGHPKPKYLEKVQRFLQMAVCRRAVQFLINFDIVDIADKVGGDFSSSYRKALLRPTSMMACWRSLA